MKSRLFRNGLTHVAAVNGTDVVFIVSRTEVGIDVVPDKCVFLFCHFHGEDGGTDGVQFRAVEVVFKRFYEIPFVASTIFTSGRRK